jgi:hypothetical protein
MIPNFKRILIALGAGMLITLWVYPPPLKAAPIAAMATEADAIVMTTPRNKVSYWDGNIIRTRATLDIKQVISGTVKQRSITVIYDGGVVGSIGLKVSHGVRIPAGIKNILFLKHRGAFFTVLNQIEGVYFVIPDKNEEMVVPAEAVPHFTPGITVKSARISTISERGVPLKEFLSALKKFKH